MVVQKLKRVGGVQANAEGALDSVERLLESQGAVPVPVPEQGIFLLFLDARPSQLSLV